MDSVIFVQVMSMKMMIRKKITKTSFHFSLTILIYITQLHDQNESPTIIYHNFLIFILAFFSFFAQSQVAFFMICHPTIFLDRIIKKYIKKTAKDNFLRCEVLQYEKK